MNEKAWHKDKQFMTFLAESQDISLEQAKSLTCGIEAMFLAWLAGQASVIEDVLSVYKEKHLQINDKIEEQG